MEAMLEVQNLTKKYLDFALDDISFTLPKGRIMGIIGENGAGKSTTINAILDLISKDSGTITFCGEEIAPQSKSYKDDIGVVFDTLAFPENLTPNQVGKISKNAYLRWEDATYKGFLEQFQLPLNKKIK